MHKSASEGATPDRLAPHRTSGFSIVELLVVVAIVVVVMALSVPAFNALKGSGNVTSAAYDVAGAIRSARAYALANNTYVWLGFYEEDSGSVAAGAATPPYPGKGRLVIAAVASSDGTHLSSGKDDTAMTLPAASLRQLGRAVKIENVHLTDVGAPSGGDSQSLVGRPMFPYDDSDPRNGGASHFARISSDSSDKTKFPFVAQNYTFHKTIRFSPRGEANVNSTYDMRPLVEVGLRPTHGSAVDDASKNVVAVQVSGIAGNVKIYRQ